MPYYLLTGATGLLGQYLLREALLTRLPVAVLVRPLPGATGRQRVEAVLQRMENEQGRALPRPVVIEGSLDQPGLGLPQPQHQWLAENCNAVIHSAASITFYSEPRSGEPYRSNVTGMRHLLQLCRECEIGQFHYISTAYVCGLRSGRILEQELDAGQTLGNDYERSKFEAERLLRKEAFPTPPTIYRPSIIVGDSVTAYTSAFHGVYSALRILWQLAQQDEAWADPNVPFFAQLDLRGDERKNLVSVDWAAAAIMHIVRHAQHHGQTYHVTHPSPVAVKTIGRAFGDAVAACRPTALEAGSDAKGEPTALATGDEPDAGRVGPEASACRSQEGPGASAYRSQDGEPTALAAGGADVDAGHVGPGASAKDQLRQSLGVYEAYFRDDPDFDSRNLQRAIPHLPCPPLGYKQLRVLGETAIRDNFGWPRKPPPELEFDLERELQPLMERRDTSPHSSEKARAREQAVPPGVQEFGPQNGCEGRLHLELSGPGGGAWSMTFANGRPVSAEPGINAEKETAAGVYATMATFLAILRGEVTAQHAIAHGRVVATGASSELTHVEALLVGLCEYLRVAPHPPTPSPRSGARGSR